MRCGAYASYAQLLTGAGPTSTYEIYQGKFTTYYETVDELPASPSSTSTGTSWRRSF